MARNKAKAAGKPPSWDAKVRRKKYQDDPAYRERAIKQTRKQYRAQHGVRDDNCGSNLKNLSKLGVRRRTAGSKGQSVTFTIAELAGCMNRHPQVLYRWIEKGMLPAPGVRLEKPLDFGNMHNEVYSLQQARAMIEVMSGHQRSTPYYRADHRATRDALFAAHGGA